MAKPTQIEERLSNIERLLGIQSDGIESIAFSVEKLEKHFETFNVLKDKPVAPVIDQTQPMSVQAQVNAQAVAPEMPQYPVPQEYIQIVSDVLNKSFGVNITPMSDSPAFQFNIIVPEKYSSMTPDQKKMMGADIRSKVITYAEGVNGVKLWAEKVFNNFNPEMRAMILADRINIQSPQLVHA